MSRARYLVLGVILAIAVAASAQVSTAPPSRQPGGTEPSADTVNPNPQSALLRILTPVASQTLSNNAITVRFELTNPGAYAGTPNFLVQLDGLDAVRTSTTSQTFTGLAPGAHSVTVTLVDANDTPIQGGRASVQFVVAPQQRQPAAQGAAPPSGDDQNLELASTAQNTDPQAAPDLPKASSPLPLISVIGFGILVGGIVSAMKTRS